MRYLPILTGAVSALVLGMFTLTGHAEVQTAIGSDVSARELRSLTVESWDQDYSGGGYGWEVLTNQDQVEKGKPYEPIYSDPQVAREVKLLKGTPSDIRENLNFENAQILAFRFAFTFPGDRVVTVRPPPTDEYVVERPRPFMYETGIQANYERPDCYQDASKSRFPKNSRAQVVDCVIGVEMPGQVQAISVWVMGRGNNYELEGWLEDWMGNTHIIKFGSLDFVGWRPLTARIPKAIPQDVNTYPQVKTMVFRQFKIRAKPQTSLEPVIVYMDELRILTDIFEVHYDGAQIDFDKQDCETKNHLLRIVKRNARNPEAFPALVDCSAAPASSGGGGGGQQPQNNNAP